MEKRALGANDTECAEARAPVAQLAVGDRLSHIDHRFSGIAAPGLQYV
jgi:hypothetical protein